MGTDRTGWDNKGISALAEKTKPFERKIALKINEILCEISPNFEVRGAVSKKGSYERYDLEIFYNNREKQQLLLRVEVEVGLKQLMWENFIPSHWYALSLLDRKDYTKSDVFIKHNLGMTSMFAIDCVWFVESIKSGKIKKVTKKHNLGVKTSKEFYHIDLKTARNTPDNVVICENSNFDQLKSFLKKKISEVKASGKYD